jgi:uncharacterized protein YecT (DUF1311 family)
MRSFSLTLAAIAIVLAAGACGKKRPADALDENAIIANAAEPAAAEQPEKMCASSSIYDKIKLELFREAAAVRGRDQATYDKIAAYSAVRVDEPVVRARDEALRTITCTARLSLDLPPGLEVAGGRRSLVASIGYTVQPAADGSGEVVTLSGVDPITVPLATLAKVGPPPPSAPITPVPSDPLAPIPESAAPSVPVAQVAQPSFDCAKAKTRGEQAVCASTGLAALDRTMATYYNRVMASADDGTAAELRRTRDRFIAYRERCTTDACIADAYRGRMREIGDIAAGR